MLCCERSRTETHKKTVYSPSIRQARVWLFTNFLFRSPDRSQPPGSAVVSPPGRASCWHVMLVFSFAIFSSIAACSFSNCATIFTGWMFRFRFIERSVALPERAMTLSIAIPVTGTSKAPLIFPASISSLSLSKPAAASRAARARTSSLRLLTSAHLFHVKSVLFHPVSHHFQPAGAQKRFPFYIQAIYCQSNFDAEEYRPRRCARVVCILWRA
jgi:hypothetical protein